MILFLDYLESFEVYILIEIQLNRLIYFFIYREVKYYIS